MLLIEAWDLCFALGSFFGGKTHNVLILVVTFGQTLTVVKARPQHARPRPAPSRPGPSIGQGQNLWGQGQGLTDLRGQCQKSIGAYIWGLHFRQLYVYAMYAEHCTCRLILSCRQSWPRLRRQILCSASKSMLLCPRVKAPGPRRSRPGSPRPRSRPWLRGLLLCFWQSLTVIHSILWRHALVTFGVYCGLTAQRP